MYLRFNFYQQFYRKQKVKMGVKAFEQIETVCVREIHWNTYTRETAAEKLRSERMINDGERSRKNNVYESNAVIWLCKIALNLFVIWLKFSFVFCPFLIKV